MAQKTIVSIRMPSELEEELGKAAEKLGMSKQDIIRKSLELGLPVFARHMGAALAEARGEKAAA